MGTGKPRGLRRERSGGCGKKIRGGKREKGVQGMREIIECGSVKQLDKTTYMSYKTLAYVSHQNTCMYRQKTRPEFQGVFWWFKLK